MTWGRGPSLSSDVFANGSFPPRARLRRALRRIIDPGAKARSGSPDAPSRPGLGAAAPAAGMRLSVGYSLTSGAVR